MKIRSKKKRSGGSGTRVHRTIGASPFKNNGGGVLIKWRASSMVGTRRGERGLRNGRRGRISLTRWANSKIKGITLVLRKIPGQNGYHCYRTGRPRLIRIIRSRRIVERDDGRLNTEVIVRGIVVPGYSYVNLDQTFHEGIEPTPGWGREAVEERIGRVSAYEYLHEVIISSPGGKPDFRRRVFHVLFCATPLGLII